MARSSTTRHGNGKGLFGPAKGLPDRGEKAPPFEPGNIVAAGPHSMHRSQQAQAVKDHLLLLVTTAERQETQVRAAEAWLNREEGMPVARSITYGADDLSDLSDTALADRQAELARALREGADGTASPARPPLVPDVRH